jgi:hypothetical protein
VSERWCPTCLGPLSTHEVNSIPLPGGDTMEIVACPRMPVEHFRIAAPLEEEPETTRMMREAAKLPESTTRWFLSGPAVWRRR